jgi:hypothetical protein
MHPLFNPASITVPLVEVFSHALKVRALFPVIAVRPLAVT